MRSSACWVYSEGDNNECMGDGHDDEHWYVDNDVNNDDAHDGVEAAFQNYKTENCWETQLAAIFLFNADGCGWLPST